MASPHRLKADDGERERRPPSHLRSEEGMLLRDNVFGTPSRMPCAEILPSTHYFTISTTSPSSITPEEWLTSKAAHQDNR